MCFSRSNNTIRFIKNDDIKQKLEPKYGDMQFIKQVPVIIVNNYNNPK